MSTSKPYAVNAVFTLKADRRDEFIEIIKDDQRLSLKDEEGIVRFVVGEDKDKENTFYLHEEYVNEDAFKKHMEMPHFKPWDDFTKTSPWAEGGEPAGRTKLVRGERSSFNASRSVSSAETCDATDDCQAGTPRVTEDGVGCTAKTKICANRGHWGLEAGAALELSLLEVTLVAFEKEALNFQRIGDVAPMPSGGHGGIDCRMLYRLVSLSRFTFTKTASLKGTFSV